MSQAHPVAEWLAARLVPWEHFVPVREDLDDLAERAGMSPSTLSRLESGKRQASLELLLPLTRQLGIRLDAEKNAAAQAGETVISADDSPAKVMIIPTNEELVVAREVKRYLDHRRN